ncbi:LysR substrate-binding domain-containing protein [Anaerocolumna aminovalerica]|uniref:DNA-binding transcriptional regulator, LysR family n=1 Tax=Anaerocolumna aminovalerica TaxID=1527 RepID=A0A1I5GTU7_9FIRM|nr:LysR family transcriptional regulator [Anaerocolumna aminovalerica]MBU5330934.1 LysR family transcriptional regulator [Anaerocolumna aminovalerica]MDU6264128.1 LysR family transcriptional regulator [Anaerocolumna aminovalerica]SFO39359.1 DNA-binding transcriptional regulator, LysR family [Anaerocolumna aminovalerica]
MIDSKLYTLLAVVEFNSYTHAAEHLSLTQPAVTQHIKQLEKELNIKIFNRVGNEIKPTNEGNIVIRYARRIIALYQNMEQSIIDEQRNIRRFTVGITHTAESNAVAEVLGKYSAKNPGTSITIITDSISNLYDMLKNYEVDLAVVEGKMQDDSINSLLLDTDSLVLVVSNNHPLAKKSMVTINELKKQPLILRRPSSGTRNLFTAHLESNNMSLDEFNVILEVDNIATIKDLIRRDIGVSILSRSVCLNELKKGKITVLPIENLSMIREINVLYHNDFKHVDILKNIMKEYSKVIKFYAS